MTQGCYQEHQFLCCPLDSAVGASPGQQRLSGRGLISSLRAPLDADGGEQPPTPVTTPTLLPLPFLPTVKLCAHHCGSHGRCTPPPPVMSSTPSAYPATAGALLWIQPANQSSLDLFSSQSHVLSNLLAWLPLWCSSSPTTPPPRREAPAAGSELSL